MNDSQHTDWLVRPTTIRWLWRWFIAVLAMTVMAQLFIKVKGYFVVDGWFAFGAVFGFLACVIMVLVSKVLGVFLKRNERYYDDELDDA